MNKNVKKIATLVGVGAFAVGVIGASVLSGIHYNNNPVVQVEYKNQLVEVPVEIIKEIEVLKEVPVEVIKEVEVIKVVTDTELIQATCDRLLFEDLGECQSEVKAEDEALALAWAYLEASLEDESFVEDNLKDSGLIEDEDEFKVIKTYKSFDDITIVTSDYDDDEYEFVLKVKVEDQEAEVKKYLLFNIEVSDGKADFVEVAEE